MPRLREYGGVNVMHLDQTPVPPAVRIELLGPLRLLVDGEEVDVRGERRRAVLAMLALAPGRVVPVDSLVEELWAEDPPDDPRQALHSLLSRLRGHLAPHAASLERQGEGYRLSLPEGATDVADVRSAVAEARRIRSDDVGGAIALLAGAARRWRGVTLHEFDRFSSLAATAVSLEELRLGIEEDLLEAEIELGLGSEVVGRAAGLATAEPLRERRQLLHMRALAHAGRSAEALRVANDHRRRLADETGLEPTGALGELEAAIAGGQVQAPRRPAEPTLEPAADPAAAEPVGAVRSARRVLPRPTTALIGREAELAALRRLLDTERLVTVVGPPGVGKTRLAAELALPLAMQDPDAISFTRLAAVGSDAEVAAALAGALGIRVGPAQTAAEAVEDRLCAAPHLAVLDNCEHLLPGVRTMVTQLLDACPELRVLLTSRRPSRIPGECVLRLPPLSPGPADSGTDWAVELFLDRARRVRPEFDPGPEDLELVAEVVRRIDGLPLTIELAASRLSTFSLHDLAARLDRAIDLLGATGDHEQRTLRSTLDWSYRLLRPSEQRLLRFMGGFADGFDLAAVEEGAHALDMPTGGAVELSALVDASMVEVRLHHRPRYRLLETVRAFCQDEAAAIPGEIDHDRAAFLAWARATAATIAEDGRSEREVRADRRLRAELGNLRAAHRTAMAIGDVDTAVALTVSLAAPGQLRDLPAIWSWAIELATSDALRGHPQEAAALGAAAVGAWLQGDLAQAQALGDASVAVDPGEQLGLNALAAVTLFRGEPDLALARWLAAAESHHRYLASAVLAAAYAGRVDEAWALHDRSLELARRSGSLSDFAFTRYSAGELLGHRHEAIEPYSEAIAAARRAGAAFVEGIAGVGLSSVYAALGRDDEALEGYDQLVRYWRRTGSWTQQWTTLRNVADLLARRGDVDTAALIHAAAGGAPEASLAPAPELPAPLPEVAISRHDVVARALEAIARQR